MRQNRCDTNLHINSVAFYLECDKIKCDKIDIQQPGCDANLHINSVAYDLGCDKIDIGFMSDPRRKESTCTRFLGIVTRIYITLCLIQELFCDANLQINSVAYDLGCDKIDATK